MKIFILGKICPYYEDTISKLQVSGCHITCMSDTKIASNFTYDYQKYHSLETYLSNFKNAAFDLDSGLIKSFETTEFNFICNSDRLAHTNVTIKKRRLIFRAILSYWFVELKKNKFDFILFRSTPHQLVDVIIWDLAKFFGIPCCYSERVLLTNKMFFRWDLRVLPNSDPMLNKLSINKLKIRYEKLCLPKVLTENPYTKRSKSNAHTQNLFPKGTQILKKFKNNLMRLLSNNKNKYDLGSISFLENKETFFSYYYFLINKILDDRRLYQIYQNLSSNIDLEVQNYVFFAMQVQPERSSYPLAGVFDDQITSIKMLSDSIPNNWKVFVKEHPKLLRNPNLTSKNYRSHEYYSFINSLPNVELVSIDVESKELIDNAQAVFTATGSVGWEALLQSKKVGVFGFPWYLGCSTIFEIRTKKDIKKLLDYSMSTELVDRSLMEYFITYSDLFFTGARDYNFTDKNDENYDFLVSNFAESIKNFKKYQKRWIKLS